MQHKREQLESSLQRVISQIMAGGMSDPRIRGLISVTKVDVNSANHEAIICVSVLPEEAQEMSVAGLNHATSFFRTEIAKKVRIRRVPRLRFVIDDSLKKHAAIMNEIQKVAEEEEARASKALDSSGDSEQSVAEEGLNS